MHIFIDASCAGDARPPRSESLARLDELALEDEDELRPLVRTNRKARSWLESHESFYAVKTYAYVMPPERSIDVDEAWDLHLCELILRDRLARD